MQLTEAALGQATLVKDYKDYRSCKFEIIYLVFVIKTSLVLSLTQPYAFHIECFDKIFMCISL